MIKGFAFLSLYRFADSIEAIGWERSQFCLLSGVANFRSEL